MKNFPSVIVGVLLCLVLTRCSDDEQSVSAGSSGKNYRQEMRGFVQAISSYAKGKKSDFFVVPQNGQELTTTDGNEDGPADVVYLGAIDGIGREDLFYGYNSDDESTPASEREWISAFLDTAGNYGVTILVTDYCRTITKMDNSYSQNAAKGYISFAADERDLNNIPDHPAAPPKVNSSNVSSLADAENFLYLLDPTTNFASKDTFVAALAATNYDVLIIDLFYNETTPITSSDMALLKTKANGGTRLVLCYMSVGEAEDYRYYWKSGWGAGSPAFIEAENPDWEGNYKVRYWDQDWQAVIFGSDSAYLDKIIASGFDGAYLDIIDAFEYFEE
ncbi:MAG: hypothetical protein GF398_04805 [Chitinivibrionales bacterium]|nr:hypothetical protein [Chitinivibrionales bacterium]